MTLVHGQWCTHDLVSDRRGRYGGGGIRPMTNKRAREHKKKHTWQKKKNQNQRKKKKQQRRSAEGSLYIILYPFSPVLLFCKGVTTPGFRGGSRHWKWRNINVCLMYGKWLSTVRILRQAGPMSVSTLPLPPEPGKLGVGNGRGL